MGYLFLWLSLVAFSLFLVAAITATASRCRKSLWHKFWPILAASLLFVFISGFAVVGGFLIYYNVQPKWLFWYGLSQAVVYAICVLVLLKRGLRGARSENPLAKAWPQGQLWSAAGLTVLFYSVTLNSFETRTMVEVAAMRSDANVKILGLLPPRLPDGLNAFTAYQEAGRAFGPPDGLPKWFFESDKPNFDPSSQEVKVFLSKQKGVLDILRWGSSLPGYAREPDLNYLNLTPEPVYSHYRNFAKLLSLSARSSALSGNLGGALDELEVISRMAEHLRSYPLMTSFLYALGFETVRQECLEYVLANSTAPEGSFIALPLNSPSSLHNSLKRFLSLSAQASLQGDADFWASPSALILGLGMPVPATHDLAWLGALPTKFWSVFLVPSDIRATREILVSNITPKAGTYGDMIKNLGDIDKAAKAGYLGVTSSIAPLGSGREVISTMRAEARRGLSTLALAAECYRKDQREYPARLEDLFPRYVTGLPADPFSGEHFKMQVIKGGLDLYSVGYGGDESFLRGSLKDPIHFYLGREAYGKQRVRRAMD